jgi:hypothetical protein
VISDPIAAMQIAVKNHLESIPKAGVVENDGVISQNIPWRPHVFQRDSDTGWYLHPAPPESDSWKRRIERSLDLSPSIKIGIGATDEIATDSDFLISCLRLDASLITIRERRDDYKVDQFFASIPDFICERRIKLDHTKAIQMLDICLELAAAASTNAKKGRSLELLIALMLSQVDYFEVKSKGIANRTQQMDVLVHNRTSSGVLANSPIVLAEAKNWKSPVTPTEHAVFLRKLESRHGKAKLGFLVTTGKLTKGVASEIRRDSKGDTTIVAIDGKALPNVWRNSNSITDSIEQLALEAAVGE